MKITSFAGIPSHGINKHSDSDDGNDYYLDGWVGTVEGVVLVYSQGFDGRYVPSTSYRLLLNGRTYYGSERRSRTERGLVIMARRFARRVVHVVGDRR